MNETTLSQIARENEGLQEEVAIYKSEIDFIKETHAEKIDILTVDLESKNVELEKVKDTLSQRQANSVLQERPSHRNKKNC